MPWFYVAPKATVAATGMSSECIVQKMFLEEMLLVRGDCSCQMLLQINVESIQPGYLSQYTVT